MGTEKIGGESDGAPSLPVGRIRLLANDVPASGKNASYAWHP